MNDSLSERAARARAAKLAADAEAQAARDQAQELERQRRLRELQDIPSAHEARKAAQKWFAAMEVDPVDTQVTDRQYNRKMYKDDDYVGTRHEWYSTILTWQLEGHSFYGDYREYSVLDERPCSTTRFAVEVASEDQDGKIIRRPANTLEELGAALKKENTTW